MNDKEFYINWLNSLDFDKEDKDVYDEFRREVKL